MIDKQVEKELESIIATARLEGYDLPENVIEKCKCILLGELDPEEEIKKIKKLILKGNEND